MSKSFLFRYLLLALLVGLLLTGVPTFAQGITCDQSASTHRSQGHDYYNAGEYALAIEQYTCALGADPNDAVSRRFRGVAYGWLGEYDKALEDLNTAIDLDRFSSGAYNNRGIVYELMGDSDSALTDYTRAIDLGGETYPYYNRGNIYYDRKEYSLALADYNKALEDNPEYPSAYNGRGMAHYAMGEYDLALTDYNKALEYDPEYASAYNNRGNSYFMMGDYDRAISDYNHSIEYRDDAMEIPYFNLALTYNNLGDYEQALSDINKSLNYDSAYTRAYLLRGNIYQTLENPAGFADFAHYVDLIQTRLVDWSAESVIATSGAQLSMEEGVVYRMTFDVLAGQNVSAEANVIDNAELDPLLVILDSEGNAVAGDDDSGLNLDAVIRNFEPSVTDTYTLLLTHGDSGSNGEINFKLSIGGAAIDAPEIYNLYVGNHASVFTTGGDRLNLRSGPGLNFDIIGRLEKGTVVTLVEGPHKANGYAWWRIQTDDGTVGWSVERVETEQTLQPALEIGEQAIVNTVGDTLNLRSGPGVAFDVVTQLARGTMVTVLEGPQSGGDFTWWKIRTEDGVEGWAVERADGERTLVGVPLPQNGE
ncbi:MAG: tetratricopeptide repeat protein [Anaerolineaceae bacterium]|nr:tetratricopeptide repeat protein [Anaerolineaceae bacterium]